MNGPITLAATDREDRHGIPDTTPPGTQPIRTLLDTAATCRPLEEVTALSASSRTPVSCPTPDTRRCARPP
ncbi:hypothetical protein J7E99_05855 [Streptomyces sp. ISL-44]|uniref:hypothetical protein n=1 Tax=Streptomyces sp. ISL-44 TaxID=2819184 RepID=UPI001BE90E6F|nr:hypothetical protein [Streptomyces sp. ISL-44]MBT2540236.1 hypothetical protein [Streptomyces sp. ISL-44]